MLRAGTGIVVALLTLIGCKGGAPDQPDAAAPATQPVEAEPASADTAAPESSDPPAGQIACHLDCSGQERTAYGATEEEARAAAREFVDEICKPEDGQFFIVCDPPAAE